jgi:hypothetical protein
MQPISGLHVASLIDPQRFDVRLYHEDWHGPFNPFQGEKYDLVFLTGLQPDFDRMRQLAYFFKRGGAKVVAGGSICTMFPEFAAQFFDAVCAGGVDSVRVSDDADLGLRRGLWSARAQRDQSERPPPGSIARLQLPMQFLRDTPGSRRPCQIQSCQPFRGN